MTIRQICTKLSIDEGLTEQALKRIDEMPDREKYARYLIKGKSAKLKKLDNLSKLAITLYSLPAVYDNYVKKGISEKIFFDTMSDIKIWCENDFERYGEKGLDNIYWISKHLSMKIFRLGRLQFEFSRFLILPHAKLKSVAKCPYRLGEKCITLHIPQGEKLDNELCLSSLADANVFFARYYPEYKYRCYTVVTWLLNPQFEQVLGKESNIVKFGKMFDLLGYVPDSDMNERRIFGYRKDRAKYVPDNALRAYTLARIQNNKPLYSYNGYRAK